MSLRLNACLSFQMNEKYYSSQCRKSVIKILTEFRLKNKKKDNFIYLFNIPSFFCFNETNWNQFSNRYENILFSSIGQLMHQNFSFLIRMVNLIQAILQDGITLRFSTLGKMHLNRKTKQFSMSIDNRDIQYINKKMMKNIAKSKSTFQKGEIAAEKKQALSKPKELVLIDPKRYDQKTVLRKLVTQFPPEKPQLNIKSTRHKLMNSFKERIKTQNKIIPLQSVSRKNTFFQIKVEKAKYYHTPVLPPYQKRRTQKQKKTKKPIDGEFHFPTPWETRENLEELHLL